MKRLFSSKLWIAIVILAIFIAGQLLGAFAIKHYFTQSKIEELQPSLSLIEEEVANGEKISRTEDYLIKAYDVYGQEIAVYHDASVASGADAKVNKKLTSYLPKVISGKTVVEFKEVPGYSAQAILIGQPLVQDNKVMGGIYILKEARAYQAALNGFYLVFFVTLAIGTIIILVFLALFIKEKNQLEQMRKDYVANISHELKTPLASIKALTETLSDHVVTDPEKIDQYYSIILRESARLEKLISDLLELSRLQHKKMAFAKSPMNTREVIKKVAEPFAILADDMDLQFHITERAKNLPMTFSNEDRITQVLTILLDNAFKFTPEQGTVTIDAKTTARKAEIMVTDNGPGISKEVLPHIFGRFNKEDLSHTSAGSGLGLSIALEIMEQLGEKISVDSQSDSGTTFTITLKKA
ncbi:HAMP domain-containing sensor histidine kinase [Microbacterium sp. APC 3898]|uniref:histidine kinase n=1 Tax=Planococcus notacanthi TaxID=3035188 RepID=A0ABT7ZJY8_9BACL|nr:MULTISPECIES: HAMP domain-containing sensor histidine kinase [Terrabacteria group]MDN3427475.1 HAMP domain-containing sensor histidine kinase [Planococcus sp. APC 4016]MDN3436825.1 HAMP domain-containing sensor histidine kinase [Planococcus sp. APC 3900]MDN3499026.1 HAMP domain-containing sensor histidine kinase [Microbacterium sp. APC 3898]